MRSLILFATFARLLVVTGWAQLPTPTPVCTNDGWTAASTPNALSGRSVHTAVWTGTEMIVWGGYNNSTYFNTGGRYNPGTDSWTPTSTANAPTGRLGHTVVWTGTEMIVWGGRDGTGNLNDGGRYDPTTDSWTAISTTNAPSSRWDHTAVWTGTEMIVWGGYAPVLGVGYYPRTGGKYNPDTDTWTSTSITAVPSGRVEYSTVWTGREMIIWGGTVGGLYLNTGGRYTPDSDAWTATTLTNVPAGRHAHTTVWTGGEMIVWGGYNYYLSDHWLNTGGRYNPGTNSWTATSNNNPPGARYDHSAVWTGTEMIVWGGYINGTYLNTGGRYYPGTDSWTATSTTNAPTGRYFATAVWTGSEMIVWGGEDRTRYLNDGGRYCAQALTTPTATPTPEPTPTPTPTPTVNISGTISYCSNPSPGPVPNVVLIARGDATTSAITDQSGNYILSFLPSGGSYDVTPSKAALMPGSPGVDTVDVIATQKHFLNLGTPLSGCRLTAADVNGDNDVNTSDVIAINRFYLSLTTGIVNTGKYQFNPVNRSYPGVLNDQTAQNYDTLVVGDVVSPFAE